MGNGLDWFCCIFSFSVLILEEMASVSMTLYFDVSVVDTHNNNNNTHTSLIIII